MGFVDVGGVVIDLCHCDGSEFIPEVVEGDEEDPVVFVGVEADSLFFLGVNVVPILIVIRPCTFELSFSPRISQLDQSVSLTLTIEDINFEEGVGMTLDNS